MAAAALYLEEGVPEAQKLDLFFRAFLSLRLESRI